MGPMAHFGGVLDMSAGALDASNAQFRDTRAQVRTGGGGGGHDASAAAAPSSASWVGGAPPASWGSEPFPQPAGSWLAEWASHQGEFTAVFKILRRLLLAAVPGEVPAKFGCTGAHSLLDFCAFEAGERHTHGASLPNPA